MKKRIFLAINLPESIRSKLAGIQSKHPELPARWTREENIHATLLFLGYVEDDEIPGILEMVEEVAGRHGPFSLKIERICYGPFNKTPRMVWAVGESSEAFGKLQADLDNSFSGTSFKRKGKAYSLHITLARIRKWDFKKIEVEERPQVEEDVSLEFEVDSVEVMESKLKRSGAEYAVLQSFPLKI